MAHEVASICLVEGADAAQFAGQEIEGSKVSPAMVSGVQLYLDVCRRLIDSNDIHLIEHKFSLDALHPPVEMFGTADFIAYSRRRRELSIVDLKYGKGVWVAAKSNPQLLYYAIGAALAIDDPVSSVIVTIVQPRYGGSSDPIRSTTVDAIVLAEWSFVLIDRARETQRPNAPLAAGPWCKFCPTRNSCLTHQNFEHASRHEAAFHQFSLTDFHVSAGT